MSAAAEGLRITFDGTTLSIGIVGIGGIGFFLKWLLDLIVRYNREDASPSQPSNGKINGNATKAIEKAIGVQSQLCGVKFDQFNSQFDRFEKTVEKRLDEGNQRFEGMVQEIHNNQLSVVEAITELKTEVKRHG